MSGIIWPQRGLKRPASVRRSASRGFDAAKQSRLTSGWATRPVSIDSLLKQDLMVLRARSRDQALNDGRAKRLIELYRKNVVGPNGFTYIPQNKSGARLATKINRALLAGWKDWCRPGVCTMDGRLSFTEVCQLAAASPVADGEFLLRMIDNPDANKYGFALQLLDPDLLDATFHRPRGVTLRGAVVNEVKSGVEIDQFGRPIRYHLLTRHPSESEGQTPKRIPVPAEDIIHRYRVHRIGQTRGIPELATVLPIQRQRKAYVEAVVVGTRVAASNMGFIERDKDGVYDLDPDDRREEQTIDVEAGIYQVLEPGEKATNPQMLAPPATFETFNRVLAHEEAAACGVAYASLTGDASLSNYSSSRLLQRLETETWREEQQDLIMKIVERVHGRWLRMALLADAIAGVRPDAPDRYSTHVFRPRGFPLQDPAKEISASLDAVDGGLTTLTDLHAEQGMSTEEVFERRRDELALAALYGVPLNRRPVDPAAAIAAQVPDPANP